MAKKINKSDIAESDIFSEIRKSAEDTLQTLDKFNQELKESANTVEKDISQAFTKSAKGLNDFMEATRKATKLKQDAEKVDKQRLQTIKAIKQIESQEERLKQQKIQTEAKELRLKEQKARAQERANKQAQRAAKLAKDENSEYKKLVKTTRDLKNESKELASQMLKLEKAGEKNTKQYRELSLQYKNVTKSAQNADAQLKRIDSTVGDNFRNVGNYGQAIGKLKSMLGGLGVAFGGFQLLRDAGKTVVNFEQSIANLSAITGATGDDLKKLENAAIELGGKTTLSASQVAEGFKLIGSAKPELLENQEALIGVTDSAIVLAEAAGITLPESASALTNTLNQFGASADEAGKFVDVLAAGSKFGAGDINFLNSAMEKAGTVANVAGLSFRETASALEVIAKSGAPAEKAGTDFRNVLVNLQKEGIGFVDGQFNIREALIQTKDSLDSISDPAERAQKAAELFGKQSLATGEFLMQNIDLYDELNDKLDENGIAQEQQKTNTETLGGAIAILKSKWEELILRFSQGNGVASILRDVVISLANNLQNIVRVIGILVKGFIAYKTAQAVVIARQKILNLQLTLSKKGFKGLIGNIGKSIKGMLGFGKGVGTATKGVKGFGRAIKSIPFVAIIGAVLELASAFFDLFENTELAAEAEERLQQIQANRAKEDEKIQANLEKTREGRASRMEQRFLEIEQKRREQIANNLKSQKEADKEAIKSKEEVIKTLQKEVKEDFKGLQGRFAEAKKLNDFLKSTAFGTTQEQIDYWGMNSARKQLEWLTDKGFTDVGDGIRRTNEIMDQGRAQTDELNKELQGYNNQLKDITLTELERDKQHKKSGSRRLREIRTEFSNQIDLLEELNKLTAEYVDLQKELADIEREADLSTIERRLDAELEAIKKASELGEKIELSTYEELQKKKLKLSLEQIEEDKKAEINAVEEKFEATIKKQEDKLKGERDRLIENAKGNTSKIKEIENNYQKELDKLDKMRVKAEENKAQQITNIEKKALLDRRELTLDITEETSEKLLEIQSQAIENRTNRELREEELRLLTIGAKKEEIQRALNEKEIELLEKQISDKKELGIDTLEDEIKLAKLRRKISEEDAKSILESERAQAEQRIAIAKAITDAYIRQSEKRIEQIDKEIEAAEKQADFFREKAIEGNIVAEESLAEQQRIIQEANARKEREQIRQQRAQFALTAYETYQRNASDETIQSPLAKTITDLTLLKQFIDTFTPTFLEGTEDTGTNGRGIDGKGGFHAILHPNERVLTKEQNKLVGGLTNEELSLIAHQYNTGSIIRQGEGAIQVNNNNWLNSAVLNRLESLESTISNKEETNIELGEIIGGAMEIIKTQKKGNQIIYNRYKVK